MKLTTMMLRRSVGGATVAAILAGSASAQSPSGPTPPAPAPQAESPTGPHAESPTAPRTKPASQLSLARLGQMLAPIALYPDDLLADILMAATYPLDVVEAARWLQDPQNTALKGDQLFAALQQKSWDPSVKSLAPFPRILRMLDANLEWTERLGEAYLADPAAVMDAVQRLRRLAQSAGRVVGVPQEIVRTEQEHTRTEEPITIEPPSPAIVYVPICDPSFAYGPWPYPDYPPFFPLFAGAAIGGCGWINGPIVTPFWGWAILNFRTRHIEIDRKRLALFERDRDRERDRGHTLSDEWRHDPDHRGNVPYRDGAVSALFGRGSPAADLNPAFHGLWTSPARVEGPSQAPLPQDWQHPGMQRAEPLPNRGWRRDQGIRSIPGPSSIAGVRRVGAGQPALERVNPTGRGVPVGQPLNSDAETRPQDWQHPGMQRAEPLPNRGWRRDQGIRSIPGPSSIAGVRRVGAGQPALEGVNPTGRAAPVDAETRPQNWQHPGMQRVEPLPDGGRTWGQGIRSPPEWGPSSTAGVRRQGAGQPALEGVNPTGRAAPVDAETRLLIERGWPGRAPPTALAPPPGGLRASPLFGGVGSPQPLGDRGSFRSLVGVGAQPVSGRGSGVVGTHPLSSWGPQMPSGGIGAGGGGFGR
jgi:hypothetical protein